MKSRLDDLHSLRSAHGDVAFATAFVTLTTGAFLVGFVQSVGGSALWVNLLAAIPSLVGILQIPGSVIGSGFPSYKKFIAVCGFLWRGLYIPIVALPILALRNDLKLWLLATCMALAWAAVTLANPTYNEWLAKMVPPNSRGSYFGRRNAIGVGVGAIVGIVGAFLLDALNAAGKQQTGFALVFSIGLVCACGSMFYFLRMHDIERPNPVHQNLLASMKGIRVPFRDKSFRAVLIFLALAVASQAFAGNLFAAFALETLHLDYKVVQGTQVMQAIGMIVGSRMWGFVSDKYGNKPVLMLAGIMLAFNPIPWVFCVPNQTAFNSALLLSTHVLMGIGWGGVNLCQFNIMLATSDPEDRANYIGAGLALCAIVGGISPLLGAGMYTSLLGSQTPAVAYKLVFACTAAMRLIPLFALAAVKEQGSRAVATTLRDLRTVTPRGYRALRSLVRPSDPEDREAAIQDVGTERVSLAADEIVKALHDPLPRVRRNAALALARLNDERATGELIHQLVEHPDLVEEETIHALGDVGGIDAVRPLLGMLQSPRSLLRRASARALGQVGARTQNRTDVTDEQRTILAEASRALTEAAAGRYDVDLQRSALQALRSLGTRESAGVISSALLEPAPSVRTAAAEAVSELELRDAAPQLRESMCLYKDESTAEVAYALGTVGTLEDIPAILAEANRNISMITRRRCLLGVALLLGVEREAYKLMLMEGMDRDNALMSLARPISRRHREVQMALSRFTAGEETDALRVLAEAGKSRELTTMAANPVAELFLVALAYASKNRI